MPLTADPRGGPISAGVCACLGRPGSGCLPFVLAGPGIGRFVGVQAAHGRVHGVQDGRPVPGEEVAVRGSSLILCYVVLKLLAIEIIPPCGIIK